MHSYSTRQRKVLLSYLSQHPDELLSARQIEDALADKKISLSAVYRNLAQLETEEKVRRSSKSGTREVYYQYLDAESCKGALHMSCIKCGNRRCRIMDMTNLNGYLVPKMAMKETHRPPVGRIGLQREKFLQENHSLLYDKMLLDGTLYSDLKQTEQRYWEQVEQTITKLLVSNPAPDKNNDPLGWTAHMNSLQAQAAELAMPIVTSL